ncbi:hypothetical protein [Borrelia miyamotoi]|uniref:hypothetical protein n=1 Tax=Borrelia miyamotoi TaxID=47466 RepID=UPI0022B32838|nr:hypothetical protein [Borrelia miyamotoi]WAZ96530.1 hypothetical protein O5405_04365 [Borrelia miyamotoi]
MNQRKINMLVSFKGVLGGGIDVKNMNLNMNDIFSINFEQLKIEFPYYFFVKRNFT